jgi:hypothetical protein
MKAAAWLALLCSTLLGAVLIKIGAPVIRTYPSTDGSMVVKLSLSKAPGFVAYLRTGGSRVLQQDPSDIS